MSIPRGLRLVVDDLDRAGWRWRGLSYRGHVVKAPVVDGHQVRTEVPAVWTIITAYRAGFGLFAAYADGSWAGAWARHPEDPAPVAIGARAFRPLLTGDQDWPRWTRPDLGEDEGTPAHLRWSPVVEAGAQAGMDRIAHYNRTREWPS